MEKFSSNYQKEKKKVLILLGIGVIFNILFVANYGLANCLTDVETLFGMIAFLFYPVGIVYGWREILNFYYNLRKGDRFSSLRSCSWTTIMISVLWISLAVTITFFVGWIFGVKKAFSKLKECKALESTI